MFESYRPVEVTTSGAVIRGQMSALADAPALVLLHGHPQTHVIWHKIAEALAERFTVVALDLRGYGASSAPSSTADHAPYSKRAMAADVAEVMRSLGDEHGFGRFSVLAHDRGARVAHRLMIDHADVVDRGMLLDIAPTLDMYEGTTRAFAESYFHWFFLIQPAPLPEQLIGADPSAYVEGVIGNRYAGLAPFTDDALEAYRSWLRDPDAVHAMCEDYRASATIDLEHERADRDTGTMIAQPLRLLWGSHGSVGRLFDPLALWSAIADDVTGRALECGHYVPEERPDDVLDEAIRFFG